MLDLTQLRHDPERVAELLARRGFVWDVSTFQTLEAERKTLQTQTQTLQSERKQTAKAIGQAKQQGQDDAVLRAQGQAIAEQLKTCERRLDTLLAELKAMCLLLPNLPEEDVPQGRDEHDNVLISTWGVPKDFGDAEVLDHVAIGQAGGLSMEEGARLSGSRFVVLRGPVARLHRALAQWMLDQHTTQHGYEEHYVPYIVGADCLIGTGQLPKFEDDQFKTNDEQGSYLIPTAEVPLTNLVREQIINAQDLPLKMVAHTPCFRKEAGSYGKDTRGMIRVHQFDKVELVQVVDPEDSAAALEALCGHAEAILQGLNLPYRKMLLCAGDMGFAAQKTYDLEVWLPSQRQYREIASCSNAGAFQARRMQTRCRKTQGKTQEVHTLNGSGVAVGRALVAVLENYQIDAHHISLPQVLRPYFQGADTLDLSCRPR